MFIIGRYVCIKQNDEKDCGVACLATICKHYGLQKNISKIREISGTDNDGTSALGLIKGAEKLGFSAKGVKGDKESIFSEFPLPAIAHIIVDNKFFHYVVIHKISKKAIIIADPAKGIIKYTPDDFFNIWTGILIILKPTINFKKGNEKIGLIERFLPLVISQKFMIFQVILCSLFTTILGLLGSFYIKFLLDDILPYNLNSTLHILSIGVIIAYVFQVFFTGIRSHLLLFVSQKFDISLLLGYYEHIMKLPMNFFSTRKTGEIISRFNDAISIKNILANGTVTIILDSFMFIIGAIILYFQNIYLFGIALLIALLYILTVIVFNKKIKKENENLMESNSKLTSYLIESLNGIETIKLFNAERKINLKIEKKFITFIKNTFNLSLTSNLQSIIKMSIELIGSVLILWVGSIQVFKGNISAGELITFNALLVYFLNPIKNLINLQPQFQTALVASNRLGEILDLDVEIKDDKKITPSNFNGDIEFKNVNFRYGIRKLILKNINLTIKSGEKIALVGESGSGKTTLAKLLLNFYEIESGEILIDNYNILDIDKNILREKIAYVSQDTFLFSGTIIENLTLGIDNLNLEDVIQACKMAQAHDFINNLPLRYDTYIEENGSNLSGGQKQRLSIARAILKNPNILIFDEATSNLDSITENAIDRTLKEFSKDITTIIIAHRLSTVMNCDKIIVLNNGEIVEYGTHNELISKNGRYYSLWKEQYSE